MTPVIRILVFANIGVFLLQQMAADALFTHFALWPIGQYNVGGPVPVGFEIWQLVTSAFLHSPKNFAAHRVQHVRAVVSSAAMVERAVGSRRFAWLYAASVLSASLVQLLVVTATADQGAVPTVGASGGVFGVLLAFAFLFPHQRLIVFPIPIPMKAWVLVTLLRHHRADQRRIRHACRESRTSRIWAECWERPSSCSIGGTPRTDPRAPDLFRRPIKRSHTFAWLPFVVPDVLSLAEDYRGFVVPVRAVTGSHGCSLNQALQDSKRRTSRTRVIDV